MSSSSEKLNVVYVFCDQLSATAVSYAGNPDVHTPNIDRLAAEGVRFDRGYCTFPLCTPARASMFSGRNPHEVGVPFNGHGIDERYREQELGNLVRAAGYECGYGGKWHVREIAMPVDNDHGFEVYSGWDDSNLAGRCVDYMREHRDGPFFVVASFDNPHNVCEMAREQILPWGPVPEVPRIEDCPPLPPNWPVDPYEPGAMQSFRAWFRRHHALGESYTADQWRRYRYLYYRIVERADREVGRILEGIDELGLADSTLVIFSSDHGDMAGAHGFTQKTVLYDDAVRVPFIFRGPGVEKGKVVPGALASNGLDLLPTICDYAARAGFGGLGGAESSALPRRTRSGDVARLLGAGDAVSLRRRCRFSRPVGGERGLYVLGLQRRGASRAVVRSGARSVRVREPGAVLARRGGRSVSIASGSATGASGRTTGSSVGIRRTPRCRFLCRGISIRG